MAKIRSPKILLVANTAWNLWHFRRALIEVVVKDGFEVVVAAPDDGFGSRLSGIPGVHFILIRHLSRDSKSPLHNLITFWELLHLLRRIRPDLAVFYTIKPNIFGSFAARMAAVPAIATIEGLGYMATAPAWLRTLVFRLYALAFSKIRKVVFLNPDDREEFVGRKVIGQHKTLVIKGVGIDTNHFTASVTDNTSDAVFLFAGRLLSDKGIREYVQAAEMVKKTAPEARFLVLGNTDSGNPASIGEDELAQWIQAGLIEYRGYADDIRPVVAGAGVVVLPSYREGLPLVLLEGLAMGKPLITTDTPGCRETVDQGVNGLIVPPENVQALAEAMLQILHWTPEKRRAAGLNSRRKAETEFSNAVILPQYLDLWRQVLSRP